MSNQLEKYGPWALITGASYGLGEEFARQLAAAGFNLILVARSEDKLKTVSFRIEKEYGVKAMTVTLDLSDPGFLQTLVQRTDSLEVGLVVSNAGAYNYGAFHKRDPEELVRFLRLNTEAHMQLVHYFGNKMKRRKKGGILMVSSMGAFTAIPYMASYAAAKSYVLSLGQALHLELKEYNVDVMVLAPGTVETPGTMDKTNVDNNKLGVSFMAPQLVVQKALKDFGRKSVCIPGGINKFSYFLGKHILSRMAMTKMLGGIMRKAISKDYL